MNYDTPVDEKEEECKFADTSQVYCTIIECNVGGFDLVDVIDAKDAQELPYFASTFLRKGSKHMGMYDTVSLNSWIDHTRGTPTHPETRTKIAHLIPYIRQRRALLRSHVTGAVLRKEVTPEFRLRVLRDFIADVDNNDKCIAATAFCDMTTFDKASFVHHGVSYDDAEAILGTYEDNNNMWMLRVSSTHSKVADAHDNVEVMVVAVYRNNVCFQKRIMHVHGVGVLLLNGSTLPSKIDESISLLELGTLCTSLIDLLRNVIGVDWSRLVVP